MPKETAKKELTDDEVKKKAVKLVVVHIRKKIPKEFLGSELVDEWMEEMEKLLEKPGFVLKEYIELRKKLNEITEEIPEEEIRFKLRDSWYSYGKALDKKAKKM